MTESHTKHPQLRDAVMTFLHDIKLAARSLARAKGLALTVVLTLALGIGANAAIFSLVRGVLLRPLVNRDEDRLIYIRQSARGAGIENATFSVPEIRDLRAGVKTLSRSVTSPPSASQWSASASRARSVPGSSGSYFDVMGLRPVLGRLPDLLSNVRYARSSRRGQCPGRAEPGFDLPFIASYSPFVKSGLPLGDVLR